MNNNPLLGQVLGGLFGQAMNRRGVGGAFGGGGLGGVGGGLGGLAIGGVLAGMLGGRRGPLGGPARGGGGRTALLMMVLPLAMRWVQQNGGIGAVLERFRGQGMARHTQSWVSTGENQPLDEQSVQQVVGQDELAQMAQRLGVPQQEVAQAFAEIMPEMVNQLSPQGEVPSEADEVLDEGRSALEREIQDVKFREVGGTS
jgi:uncharacterized protein YidB (DUF937 family)